MQGEGNNKLGGNVGQTNLNQVPIQKGRDPLGVLRTKPQPSDQFVVNKQSASSTNIAGNKSNQTRIINFNTTPKLPDPLLVAPSSKPSESFFHKPALIPISDNNSNANNDNLLAVPEQHHIFPNSNVQNNTVLNHNSSQNLLQTQSPYRNSSEDTSGKQKQQSYSIANLFGVNNLQDAANDPRLSFANNNNNNNNNNRLGNAQRMSREENNKIIEKNLDEQFMELRKFGVSRDFILKGEELKGVSDTQLKFGQYFVEGQLLLTNYKLLFVAADEDRISKFADRKDYCIIPLGFIAKIERSIEKKGLQYSFIDIICKDCRAYRFKYQPDLQNQSFEMQIKIHQLAFPEDVRKTFAYVYLQYDPSLEAQYRGWQVYDIQKEFSRQGLSIVPHDYSEQQEYDIDYKMSPFKYIDNSQANICSTYPDLLVVPSKMPFDEIIKCSRFRSRERLPVLTYAFKKRPNSSYTTLWRCAQCKPGINQNRSYEDESMLRFIGSLERSATTVKTVKIYDARPYLNAVGQQLTGKGYEMKQFYKNCEIEFLDIHNIHKVRESYKKFCNAMSVPSSEYIKEIDKSDWLMHISSIIYGTRSIIDSLLNDISVVVHCSDGWDRTAQLICLSQICIDPYYRTIEGFEVLIEKDWVAFGHQFSLRTGHASKNSSDEQRSPIFLQFLDCVYQLTEQYPLSFQFNSKFLADIAYQLNASTFGTFLYNSYQVAYLDRFHTMFNEPIFEILQFIHALNLLFFVF